MTDKGVTRRTKKRVAQMTEPQASGYIVTWNRRANMEFAMDDGGRRGPTLFVSRVATLFATKRDAERAITLARKYWREAKHQYGIQPVEIQTTPFPAPKPKRPRGGR